MKKILNQWLLSLLLLLAPLVGSAATERTQTLHLRAGWNSVFLQVNPAAAHPRQVFAQVPEAIVAGFFPTQTPVYFPRDPGQHTWQEENWHVWYAPSRPEAFLSNLHAVSGHRGYLVFSAAEVTVQVTGQVQFRPLRWQPDALNFVGFGVSAEQPPTFASFFAGAPAHHGRRLFQLVGGKWTLVREPATTRLRSGEAYWVECVGRSDFQGPLHLALPVGEALEFGDRLQELSLRVDNRGAAARQIRVELHAAGGGLVLSRVLKDLSTLTTSYPLLGSPLALDSLAAGQAHELRLAPRRELMTEPQASALLKISDTAGSEIWVPIRVRRPTTHP